MNWIFAHSFSVHMWLIGGDVLATTAVGFGIIWESSEYPADCHAVARRAVIWGIIAETLCSICLFAFDESISHGQNHEIERLRGQVVRLATNNSLLRDEGIGLRRAMLPRGLPSTELIFSKPRAAFLKLCPEMPQVSGQKILIQSVPEGEAQRFALAFQPFLAVFGLHDVEFIDERQSHLFPAHIPNGLTAYVPSTQPPHKPFNRPRRPAPDSPLARAASALVKCVNAIEGTGSANFVGETVQPPFAGYPGSEPIFDLPQPNAVLLFIGSNPVNERLYAKGIREF